MKDKRQQKIIEIISSQDVETQDELIKHLSDAGFTTTQATVSRDIRALKLRKVAGEIGHQKYALPEDRSLRFRVERESYRGILTNAILSVDRAGNLVVLKTISGVAMAAAAAIDAMEMDEIAGCIAGDDTIFVAVKSVEDMDRVIREIESPSDAQEEE